MEYAIIVALQDELDQIGNVFYTGIGKVNATRVVTEVICNHKPKKIINYGTAGSFRKDLSGLIQCTSFVQHDMDATAQGFDPGETPFESDSKLITFGKGYCCGTGDKFVTAPVSVHCDVVDMESYALAKVAQHYDIPFVCYKFISDYADGEAADSWQKTCSQGSALFKDKLKEIVNTN